MRPRVRPLAGVVLALACVAATAVPARAQQPLKVFISVDMEGITGVVSDQQLGPGGFEYERARRWMTDDALAAIRGAKEAGATAIVLADAHGNGQSLLIDQLPEDVVVVRSWPRPDGMMAGIDSSFAAAVFIGYHSGTANPAGVRAHTQSSASFTAVRINGTDVPEAGVNAAIAGWYGVPVVAVSGDDVAVAEVRKFTGPIEAAVVKQAISFHSAATRTPAAGQALIQRAVREGVRNRAKVKPYRLEGPVTLDLSLKHYRAAEALAMLPIVRRIDSHTIRYVGRDIREVETFMHFVTEYRVDLTP